MYGGFALLDHSLLPVLNFSVYMWKKVDPFVRANSARTYSFRLDLVDPAGLAKVFFFFYSSDSERRFFW